MKTYVIKADLTAGGEFDRAVEVIVTTDRPVGARVAAAILRALYPTNSASIVDVVDSGEQLTDHP